MSRKRRAASRQHRKKQSSTSPEGRVFRQFGLTPLAPERLADEVLRRFGQSVVDRGAAEFVAEDAPVDQKYIFAHDNLPMHKLILRTELRRLQAFASLLSNFSAPGARVLDIGGGAGALDFYLSRVWEGATFTIADPYSKNVGDEWARELGLTDHVRFIESGLPKLAGIPRGSQDIVLLSSVVQSCELAGSTSDELGARVDALSKNLVEVPTVLAAGGAVFVLDSWEEAEVHMVVRSLAAVGLRLNAQHSDMLSERPYRGVLVFCHEVKRLGIDDVAEDFLTLRELRDNPLEVTGAAAKALWSLFSDAVPLLPATRPGSSVAEIEVRRVPGLVALWLPRDGSPTLRVYSGSAASALVDEFSE